MIPLSPDSADLRPLDENDLVRLDALLDETGNENAMVVEEIDGFLAALACVPDVIDEEAVLGHVLGLEPGEDAASGAGDGVASETRAEIGALLRRHAARVVAAFGAGEFGPVLSYDDEGNADGVAWAVGFLRGVELHPESWDALLAEKDFADALDAMHELAAVLDDDAGDAASAAPTPGERDALIDRMIADAVDIHEFFRPYREARTTPAAMRVETVRRGEPKIGRNDPCPCGSGRKYKQCCGA
ncbi:MAG TPA: UPF0149 family protein [Zeimonas sp.]|nr:UPF0149 family protein [Zeimonas sp.]